MRCSTLLMVTHGIQYVSSLAAGIIIQVAGKRPEEYG